MCAADMAIDPDILAQFNALGQLSNELSGLLPERQRRHDGVRFGIRWKGASGMIPGLGLIFLWSTIAMYGVQW
jgi:hypothetical protein